MHSILFSILLASTLVSAIPTPPGTLYENKHNSDVERVIHEFAVSQAEANRQMQTVLENPNDPHSKTLYGPNPSRAEIKLAGEKLRVHSMDPALADQQAPVNVNAFVPGVGQSDRFGSAIFAANIKQQAGTMIHENIYHQSVGTGDVFGSLCSRSLYKRALLRDDPVGYYLSKRSQCNVPPDHLAKKAAVKDTTTVANKGTTSPARANGKASIAKSTSVKGAKDLKGAATKAKGVKTVRKGTFTRKATGAMAGKGLKTVKGTKATKGVKTAKRAKTVKGLKTAKAGKGLKAVKGAKASKGVKAVKGAKTVKSTKAGKEVKVAKGVKAAKGAKGIKGTASPKSVKAVKPTKGPKPTAALKTTGAAKAATKVATQAASKKGKNLRRDVVMILDELE